MVVSLVNPHDVLLYPKTYESGGYDPAWLEGEIGLPATVDEDLSTKPTVQSVPADIQRQRTHPDPADEAQLPELLRQPDEASDEYLVKILDTLEARGLLENTLVVATADHGEMGTAHGGLRQKNFNFYEETTRVPLVYSNPRLFPRPEQNPSIVSHVDFLPTLAGLLDTPAHARANWQGVDYSDQILRRSPGHPRPTRCLPMTTGSPARLAARTRSHPTTSSASVRTATRSPGTTTPTGRCRPNGRCMTSRPTRSSARTWPTRITGVLRSKSKSSSGSNASWPVSSRRGCSRSADSVERLGGCPATGNCRACRPAPAPRCKSRMPLAGMAGPLCRRSLTVNRRRGSLLDDVPLGHLLPGGLGSPRR